MPQGKKEEKYCFRSNKMEEKYCLLHGKKEEKYCFDTKKGKLGTDATGKNGGKVPLPR